ncbi:MAG: helix-turn-helix domain-containing protein [Fimbriimonadales bacterium]|nr:helix-turn-helix domain-containing protein [Fimbriimonadales bacterium]
MNLVDAIRKASQQRLHAPAGEASPSVAPTPAPSSQEEAESVQTVRFEVRLTNQQLYDLLQWMARNLHPVMTLREAASYLRLRSHELVTLAESGDIPAFKVDGKWRFLKNALDEWMLAQRATEFVVKEEETHVA